ncbi:LOW QUALITY PROTEIN: pleckstrin homology domain-containing family M member 1 [Denticeps clupeoides]|uniref:LOW QUALITY PROTEIN: pleckstrin homology domain-containing family M member 1 n=1 Tax=Denticeps clupeoides TaxID=299321 RepID=UPI0010A4915C|nr:LOW QUALITY PROTEIN: pleckstrin homology domain-containing family M member 1 [Denticeps clupeoides]
MLAIETGREARDVKQWIKEELAQSLKGLHKRYVTTDAMVTSEDTEANRLCCALEAVFIHGIKSKHVRSEVGGRGRKGAGLPQPDFWGLLKSVTHRNVIQELESLSFVNSGVGRCRAWLRLALNDGLLECYLTSLLRESSKLGGFYQACALLLDPEEREVLLSLLQGLASLSFQLSYKSAMLNEWTTTPLVLAGLCPAAPLADEGRDPAGLATDRRKESWDTASQSSGGSDAAKGGDIAGRPYLNSSSLSLETTGSSALSSSLSSDSLLQGHDRDWAGHPEGSGGGEDRKEIIQDSVREDLLSESSEGETHPTCSPPLLADNHTHLPPPPALDPPSIDTRLLLPPAAEPAAPAPLDTAVEVVRQHMRPKSPARRAPSPKPRGRKHGDPAAAESTADVPSDPRDHTGVLLTFTYAKDTVPQVEQRSSDASDQPATVRTDAPEPALDLGDPVLDLDSDSQVTAAATPKTCPHRSECSEPRQRFTAGRQASGDAGVSLSAGLPNSPSWISEDDFTKPELSETETSSVGTAADMNGSPDSESLRSPPSVSHGRQRGQPNPFRGLLMMGQLESRSAMGMWRGHYCELSPYELRLYLNEEERSCCENCSLLRCEDVRLLADGRFHICFPGKKLYLRAASRGEAEDWVERIAEAVGKCRLPSTCNEQWEVLQVPSAKCPVLPPVPAPSAPESKPELLPPPSPLDWTRPASPEPEAIKEALVYQAPRDEQLGDGWTPLLLSLSLEALRGFRWQDGHKIPLFSHPIHSVRDVVPDTLLGGPAFFKVLTGRETTVLRAENGDEARAWRGLIRGALDSYLQTEEDEGVQGGSGGARDGGSVQRLVQHRLKGEGELMPHLFTVPTEKGLDTQSFKCAGCTKQIGFSRRKARLCEFSALYYCDSCHRGDLTAIPSRMVHNWDLTPREVSRQAMKLLAQVRHEPLLNLDLLNPDLFDHTETMATVRELRQRLRLLGDYLLICRSGVLRKIQPRLDQRTYLLDSAHLYSVMDLQQIADGQYETFLLSLIQLSSTHVHHCDLCTQRGFICQICNANNIIFPFQFDTTTRCKECKSVFHSACKAACPTCPRCARMQRYLERELQD